MLLGIDYGTKRIGLAIGSQYPRGIGTLDNPGSFADCVEKIYQICRDYEVELIIVGIPTRGDGSKGELWGEIEKFAQALSRKTQLKVIFEEESYTSVEAEEELHARGINTRIEKDKIDELAAVLILEQYLNKAKE